MKAKNNRQKTIILPGVTSYPNGWESKVAEIDKLNIYEVALFPTSIELDERKKLYQALRKSKLKRIPHVHLRHDMEEWELDFFVDKFKTEVFNIHGSERAFRLLDFEKYRSMIYIENSDYFDKYFEKSLELSVGLCVDYSHWHDYGEIQHFPGYERFNELVKKYPIGCGHLSAILKEPYNDDYGHGLKKHYNSHKLTSISEINYINKYLEYLPRYLSIELQNSLAEQLKIKTYVEKLIGNR
jgi:hypothetical protein